MSAPQMQRIASDRASGRGFTLIEMLAVLGILSVLAMAVLPLAQMSVQRERERELKRALWEIRDAIDAYKRMADAGAIQAQSSGYPKDLGSLVKGAIDRRSGTVVYFVRRVPRDPFADPKLAPEEMWGLRSYQSGPDRPEAGVDVYDVYSRSDTVALDGTLVRQW